MNGDSMVDRRTLRCELIGGAFDGLTLDLAGRPPMPHLDIPEDGFPRSEEELYRYLREKPNAQFLRYTLDWWDGAGVAKYRRLGMAAPLKREEYDG